MALDAFGLDLVTTRKATAAKRGRNPRWPYVPIIEHATSRGDGKWPLVRRQQLRAVAFATREEAVAHAQKTIDLWARP